MKMTFTEEAYDQMWEASRENPSASVEKSIALLRQAEAPYSVTVLDLVLART
jgi:hypothetical protein